MGISKRKLNWFLLFKLPSAFFSGVRVKSISETEVVTTVKHRWINQNPFKSMFWAVQGMTAELATGVILIQAIQNSGAKVSMLVREQKGEFFKTARGRINFTCSDVALVNSALDKAINTGESQKIEMTASGVDAQGDTVSTFTFLWSIKKKG